MENLTVVDGLAAFFALGLAVLAFGLATGAFFGAGAFLVAAALVAVFLGAPLLAGAAGTSSFGLASLGSFFIIVRYAIKMEK